MEKSYSVSDSSDTDDDDYELLHFSPFSSNKSPIKADRIGGQTSTKTVPSSAESIMVLPKMGIDQIKKIASFHFCRLIFENS